MDTATYALLAPLYSLAARYGYMVSHLEMPTHSLLHIYVDGFFLVVSYSPTNVNITATDHLSETIRLFDWAQVEPTVAHLLAQRPASGKKAISRR
jgi:hypothetical protein